MSFSQTVKIWDWTTAEMLGETKTRGKWLLCGSRALGPRFDSLIAEKQDRKPRSTAYFRSIPALQEHFGACLAFRAFG